jgi:hypothetical protein
MLNVVNEIISDQEKDVRKIDLLHILQYILETESLLKKKSKSSTNKHIAETTNGN